MDTFADSWNFFVHCTNIHVSFAIIILMTVAIALLIHRIKKYIPLWQYTLLDLIAGVLLSAEIASLMISITHEVIQPIV